jgi:enoyl-CoA hydratase/carnithine racemase
MANKAVNADRALPMGLVNEVFPDETFEAEVMAFCRHLATQARAPQGVHASSCPAPWPER